MLSVKMMLTGLTDALDDRDWGNYTDGMTKEDRSCTVMQRLATNGDRINGETS